jgi:hypothetical protein
LVGNLADQINDPQLLAVLRAAVKVKTPGLRDLLAPDFPSDGRRFL